MCVGILVPDEMRFTIHQHDDDCQEMHRGWGHKIRLDHYPHATYTGTNRLSIWADFIDDHDNAKFQVDGHINSICNNQLIQEVRNLDDFNFLLMTACFAEPEKKEKLYGG
jgi:hypothetical protein